MVPSNEVRVNASGTGGAAHRGARLAKKKKKKHFRKKNKLIKKVYYPGLESHIDHDLHIKQTKCVSDNLCSGGGIISFTTDNIELSTHIVNTVKIFKISVSFGSMESLISIPANMSHESIPKINREFPDDLIRLSIGIENINDLINDIEYAINSFTK